VLGLLPILALLFLAVAVILWAVALFLQGYLYSEPVEQVYWRAPLAGFIMALFVGLWCSFDYKNPGRYGSIFDVSAASDDVKFDRFWSVRNGQEILYTLKKDSRGRGEYFDANGKRWNRRSTDGIMEAIIVEDKEGQKIRFNAERTADGSFKVDDQDVVRYVEKDGKHRVMRDIFIGSLSEARSGVTAANLFLNFFHVVTWFLCLWLLLRFQWGHALGLACVAWLVLTFFLPPLFKKTEDLARLKTTQATSSLQLFIPAGRLAAFVPGAPDASQWVGFSNR
jgi:hypothetical protein